MTAKVEKIEFQKSTIPKFTERDELDEYIRYQDEVLERNAEEQRGVIEEQERRIEELLNNQENRTQHLYSHEDPLDPLDEKITKRLERQDSRISERIQEMDRRTDEYMEELAKRNSIWRDRLETLDESIAVHARGTGEERWQERLEQKIINREYQFEYDLQERSETGVEIEGEPSEPETTERMEAAKKTMEMTAEPEVENIGKTFDERGHVGDRAMVQERERQRVKGKVPVKRDYDSLTYPVPVERKPSSSGKRPPPVKKKVPQPRPHHEMGVEHDVPFRTPKPGELDQHPPVKYACPVCQHQLVYYDKYQRWWCRTCKKWR